MSVVFSSTYGIRTFGCYMYCFFVWQLMLYFVGANIIIKGGNYDQKTIRKQSPADTGRAAKAHLRHDLLFNDLLARAVL